MEICIEASKKKKNIEAKKIMEKFDSLIMDAKKRCDECISHVMEKEWGYDALHIGNFPQDWVKPGGPFDLPYRQTSNTMMT